MLFAAVTAVLLASLAVTQARPSLGIRQTAKVISHCTVPNTAALTFILFHLRYDITATLRAANRVKHAYDMGHQVASHTWSHADLSILSLSKISTEMSKIDQAIERITGASPSFMRPPYGKYNDRVLQVAAGRKQSIVLWDLDTGDSIGASVAEQKGQYNQVAKRHPKTVLALNHEVYGARDVLPHAIKQLRSSGYRLVTVAECVGANPYQSKGKAVLRDMLLTISLLLVLLALLNI
ncbi:carbohydrate esterase family 4 protein [Ephemerocybe angulata]|uniref:Carbohydrate esterase family 4 protein n=1 Tax=Ephemerocybe angulata TaxID=980116 RepID=A0A8H6IBS4_9AGAR|nr:carbohydrate esterase family 4 protein [Tulosesus angulatus]